ncbi:MAG TPA: peptide ABC transporter substrate-binding protein [Candidatus Limnocylindrales bacterium]|nr:peptide ABC transporter substrate-binding protein [Candidatus Limnocylindrales bacterium]
MTPAGPAHEGPPVAEAERGTVGRGALRRGFVALLVLLVSAGLLGRGLVAAIETPRTPRAAHAPAAGAARSEVTILAGAPATLDPARQGDLASAAVTAQLFETLTAFDASLTIRPALAESWAVGDAGRRITFTLRPALTFSDGSPLTAGDVVASWLRLLDPAHPSPLASLLDDVAGARDYRAGRAAAAGVGLAAPDARHVTVTLDRPAADLASIVAGPSFGVVPPAVRAGRADALEPSGFVASGGYVLSSSTSAELTLVANAHYWAGPPSIATVHLRTSIGGRSPVDAFEAGDVDYTPIGDADASWIAYDAALGPQLRSVPDLGTTYYGFDASRPPFDDVRVRQAVAKAVDWRRIVALGAPGSGVSADGMVPPGIPGRPAQSPPSYDPDGARSLLASAGGPAAVGAVTILTNGLPYDAALADQLRTNLGLEVRLETMDFEGYQARLVDDPPPIWAMSWIADYPGPNDFLGVLLASDASNNYGRWRSDAFDAAIDAAGRAVDPAAAAAAYGRAAAIVARDVPVIPVSTSTGWALSRDGLLGAGQNGLGIVRFAGLAWQ